jgi:uncharacterized protein YcfJ
MWSMRFSPGKRGIAAAMACVLTLAACSGQMGGPPLTPAQMQLKQANDRFNQTVAEGAVVGAVALGLAGAALGAMAGGGRGALIGAAAGAAVGGAVGAAVGYDTARKNYAQARTEGNLRQLIAEANQDAAAYHRSAIASRDIANEARAKIAALDAQYRAKTLSASDYQRNLSSYKDSEKIMSQQLTQIDAKVNAMRVDAQSLPSDSRKAMLDDARQMDDARRALKQSHESLAATLAMAPA